MRSKSGRGAAAFAIASLVAAAVLTAQGPPASPLEARTDDFAGNPRLVVITDMGNEPDDQMSFVRLLLYSNEIDLEALVAATSTWQRNATHPETLREIVRAYEEVRPNLLQHATGWPEGARLNATVAAGQPAYGMEAVGPGRMSPGAEAIVRAGDRDDPRPLWITIWGGANTLAQALLHVRTTRPPAEVDRFIARLRVYSISDQDDAGPWMRREFPALFYIVKPSPPNGEEYWSATWTGISGDPYYRNCTGADPTTVTNQWLDEHVRSKGPLGRHYPRFAYIMEGDTPSFLGLTNNGLNSYRNPGWGGWGGRYVYRTPYGEPHAIWTQGGDVARRTSRDTVAGVGGQAITSDQATIWRWREAFQHDFAARMDWTVKPYGAANHNPVPIVNGQKGRAPIAIAGRAGEPIVLDARESRDPDGNRLSYRWFHYAEAGTGRQLQVKVDGADTATATVTPALASRGRGPQSNSGLRARGSAHIILAVTDNGSPTLTSYRRVILTVTEK